MRVAWLKDLRLKDLAEVGGKNASLGEMIGALAKAGIRVPGGFATTAEAFREFIAQGGLEKRIDERLDRLDPADVDALAAAGKEIRSWILKTAFPAALEQEIRQHYQQLEQQVGGQVSFAVRSSATAEDLPEASFAGQQETFLNISGVDNVLEAIQHVFASLYNDRAISYRVHRGLRTARSPCRRPCSRWCAATSARAGCSSRSTPSPASATWSSSPRPTGSARWWCRAPSTPTSSTSTSRCSRRAARRSCGARSARSCRRWCSRGPRPPASRPASWTCRRPSGIVFPFPTTRPWNWRATPWPSSATTAGRWISSGARTATGASTCCRRGRKR